MKTYSMILIVGNLLVAAALFGIAIGCLGAL